MSDVQQNFFLMIPTHIADSEHLNDGEKLFFGRLASLAKKEGYCFATNSYLAKLCGVNEREIQKRLNKLENLGHITKEYETVGPNSIRKIYVKFDIPEKIKEKNRDVQKDTPPRPKRHPYKDNRNPLGGEKETKRSEEENPILEKDSPEEVEAFIQCVKEDPVIGPTLEIDELIELVDEFGITKIETILHKYFKEVINCKKSKVKRIISSPMGWMYSKLRKKK